jgi:hypothetical protein
MVVEDVLKRRIRENYGQGQENWKILFLLVNGGWSTVRRSDIFTNKRTILDHPTFQIRFPFVHLRRLTTYNVRRLRYYADTYLRFVGWDMITSSGMSRDDMTCASP